MESAGAPHRWTLTTRQERVGRWTFELQTLPSFEEASADLYQGWRGPADAAHRVDLSPMFGVIWGSSRAMCEVLLTLDLADKTVLELGCGLALPSMVAARCGAARVLATDQHPDTGALLERNLARNDLAGTVSYTRLDWRTPKPLGRFDLVLASDVLYARELPALLARTFAHYLSPRGTGLLSDPGRAWLPEFETAAGDVGLDPAVDVACDAAGEEAFLVWLGRDSVRPATKTQAGQ